MDVCLICNKPLTGKWTIKYCSQECYYKTYKLKRKKINCLFCGKEHLVIRSSAKKFCDKKCANKYNNPKKPQWSHDVNHPSYEKNMRKLKGRTGKNNPNFKGGMDWLRAEIRRRENPKFCEICNSTRHIEFHHMDFNSNNNVRENIKIVCKSCHTKIHKKINNIHKYR